MKKINLQTNLTVRKNLSLPTLRAVLIVLLFTLGIGNAWAGGSTTYYSRAGVKVASTGGGTVYVKSGTSVSSSSNDNSTTGTSVVYSANGSSTTQNAEVSFAILAVPNDDYRFDKWTLSGWSTNPSTSAASATGKVKCSATSSSSPTTATAEASFKQISISSVTPTSKTLNPTDARSTSTGATGTVTFSTTNDNASGQIGTPAFSDKSGSGTWEASNSWTAGTSTVTYTFKGNGYYGGSGTSSGSRNNSATLTLPTAKGTSSKSVTFTANFPSLVLSAGSSDKVYPASPTTTADGTATFPVQYCDGAFDFTASISDASGGTWIKGDISVAITDAATGSGTVTVPFTFNAGGATDDFSATLTLTPVANTGGTAQSVTITAYAEPEASNDVSVTTTAGVTTEYATWAAGLAAANASAGCTLTLLRNIDLTTTYGLTSTQGITQTFTLDLNGKTLSAAINGSVLNPTKSGKILTIKDSKTGGRIQNITPDYNGATYAVNISAGTVNLESGIIYAENQKQYSYGTSSVGGTATNATSMEVRTVKLAAGAKFNMTGGKVEAHGTRTVRAIYQESSKANTTEVNISGGEVYAEAPSYVYGIYAWGKVNISGNAQINVKINDGLVNGNATYQSSKFDSYTLHRYGYAVYMLASASKTPSACYFGTLKMTGGTINVENVNKTLNGTSLNTEHTYGVYMGISSAKMGNANGEATDGTNTQKASSIGSIENATINVTHAGVQVYGFDVLGCYNSFDNSTTPFTIKNSTINVTAWQTVYGVLSDVSIDWSNDLTTYTGSGRCSAGNIELTNTTINATTTGGTGAYCAWASATYGTVADAKATTGARSTGDAIYKGEYAVAATLTINSGTYTANAATSSAYAVGSSDRAKTIRNIRGSISNRDNTTDPVGSLGGNAEAYPELYIHGGDFSATTGSSTTAVAVKSGGTTVIDGGTFNAYSGAGTAYGLQVNSGKTTASGVTFTANATTVAYGVYLTGTITDYCLFPYAGEVELNNCNATATARTTTDARGVYVNGATKVYTQAQFDAMKTANNSTYKTYGDYAQVGERAVLGKATINGGTYTATAETTTAYGIIALSTRVTTNKEAIESSNLVVKNATVIAKTNTGTTAYGVQPGGGALIENCTITATAGTTTASGVRAIDKTAVIKNSTITAKGTDAVYGLEGYVDISTAHGYCWHGDFDLTEAGSTKVTAESTGSTKAYTIYLNAKAANVASGTFAGDYATAANATISEGEYTAKTNGGTSGYVLSLTGTQTKGSVSAQPEVLITGGKFNGATAEVGTAGIVGHVQLKGGCYVHNTNLAKYIPEGYEEFTLPSDRPEYTEGYRYAIEPVGNHGIDVCQIGSTKYKTLEEALQVATSGNTILMIANYTLPAGDWILKSGVKLLVPYSGQTATKETGVEYVEGTATPAQNLKLSFANGAHLVCNGIIEAGAKQTGQGSSELTGQVYGSYGHIYMAEGSSMTIESGATLYAWGYVTGKGEIAIKNGGKSYEMFQFGWYKGGNTTSDINSNKGTYKIFPMTDYSYQNIECPVTYYPGASGYGKVSVKPSSYSSMQRPLAMLVGTDDNSMFKMTTAEASANTWVKKVYDPETDITNWIMNSGASISGISMNVGVQVNSADFYLPITSNFRITLNYGDLNINNDVVFLPGSQLIINKEATGILKSGKLLFFYDAEDWFTGLGHVSVTASGWSKAKTCGYYYYPATYSPTWGTSNPRKNVYARDKASLDKGITPLPDAELFLHGKLVLNGSLYTSGDGNKSSINRNANIHSTNEDAGKIIFNTNAPTASKALYKVCFAIGASEANNSWSDMIYGGQTTAYPAHLQNGDGAYEQSSGTTSGSSWIYKNDQWVMVTTDGCFSVEQVSGVKHYYAYPAAFVEVSSKDADASHLYHDAATGTRNFVWDQNCYWWEVVTTPTAEGYYKSINADYNGKYNYYYYDSAAACWKIKKITVTWNINGSTTDYSVGYGTKPEWYGGTPSKNSSSSNYYYIWDGWTASGSETLLANSELPEVTADITYTAHFYEKYYQYNITFKNDDGTILESKNWNSGSTPSYEGTPEKAATAAQTFEFNGTWSPAITTVSKAATYVAQYTATTRQYNVEFVNYDMSLLGSIKADYNTTPTTATYKAAIAPSDFEPYKPDNNAYSFNFDGWRLNGASSNGFAQVKGDQTYVAQFVETTKKYRISFVDDDGETVLHWAQLEYDAMPSYDGPATSGFNKQDAEWDYVFTGWTPATFSQVKGPQTYTANYNKTKRTYPITWVDGNGATLTTTNVEYGTTPAYPGTPTPTKASTSTHSYQFNNTWSPALAPVTGEATYTAQFNESERTYALTIGVNEAGYGSVSPASVTGIPYNAAITVNGNTFTVNGTTVTATPTTATAQYTYGFSSWSNVPGKVTADVSNIQAVFTRTLNTYTVTFKDYNGTPLKQQTVDWNTAATAPSNPSREGYTFTGWDKAFNAVTADLVVTAQYSINQYTISFNSNGGSAVTAITQNYNTAVTAPADPTREGYTFAGWSPSVPSTMPATNTNCVAQWTINQYNLIVATNNNDWGTVTGGGKYDYNSNHEIKATPATGYKFVQWNDGNTNATRNVTIPAEDVTYTATFEADIANYTVKHWQQNIANDEYTEVTGDQQSLSGKVGATTAAEATTYTGFTAQPITQGTIAGDGSTVVNIYYNRNTYTITWKDGDNNTIETDENVKYGATPTYDGATPTKSQTVEWVYTHDSWTPAVEAVTANATYTATFSSEKRKYNVTWTGEDITERTDQVAYGETPVYGEEPTKEPTVSEVFTFKWMNNANAEIGVKPVTGDVTYSGSFSGSPRPYTIRFVNDNGTELQSSEVGYGSTPSYAGTPVSARDASCTFIGWTPEIAIVGEEATYMATYRCTVAPIVVDANETESVNVNTETTTTIVHVTGALHVSAKLTTDDLILEATPNSSGEIIGSENIEATNAYFHLSREGGFKARTWYAVAVPWEVFVPVGAQNNGVFTKKDDGDFVRQVLGTTYDLIYYDGESRAEGKKQAWRYVEDDQNENGEHVDMRPGCAYMIYLTSDADTIRFKSREGAALHESTEIMSYPSSIDAALSSWNGIANPATYHAYLNAYTTGNKGQVYNAETKRYELFDMKENKLMVGQPIFIQTTSGGGSVYVNRDSNPFAQRRRAKEQVSQTQYELMLAASEADVTDRVIVCIDEDKEKDDYLVGHDLVKMGVSDMVPQMWVNRYEKKMCINTVAGFDNTADYPLGIFAPKDGEYDLFIEDQPDNESMLYLTYDGSAIWNLSYGGYVANLNKGTNTHYGLRIVKKAPQITTGFDEAVVDAKGETRKVMINEIVYIIRGEKVYTIDGQMVK